MNTLTVTLGGAVELLLRPAPPEWQSVVTARYLGFIVTAEGNEMAYTLPSGMLITVRIDYVDAQGHPAQVDGPITWATSAANVADVTPDQVDDHLCTITSEADLGTAQITASADADLGQGVRNLVTTLDVSVVAGEAMAGTISPTGDPEPIAPHVEPR